MSNYLGIDTSNYTTSAAVFNAESKSIVQKKRLLRVKEGQLGLRQNEAVFQHVAQLPEIISGAIAGSGDFAAIGVSASPRDAIGSYMPCFTAGVSCAAVLSSALKIPLFRFSHQCGHIAAAAYGAGKLELLQKKFLAFHVSGGTTEAVLVSPDDDKIIRCELAAKTLDISAGQAVDRIGNMLGLAFPAGKELEALAGSAQGFGKIKTAIKGHDCCFSGLENQCRDMLKNGAEKARVARYCLDYILQTLDAMCEKLLAKYGDVPVVFAGGVMSNTLIRRVFEKKYSAIFAPAEFSCDNAAGISVLTQLKAERS